ncbi:chromosomal replication initiator protein DnaA [Desulfonatronovibrio hydrogenovorans]|uniref:chromosomal replication initiator protein DnaA n=1 Tax=Desulfonatronovibrio hydrogenovorans TaxID=53245 RepID=UPI000A6C243F|nr:chromosomal replication initiator protein DnaA [Desulfonatronovibrio hydrogenovorans]
MIAPMMNAWERIRLILEKSLKPGLFQLWIKPLKGDFDSESSALKLEAPNEFIASWVREKLKDLILESCRDVLGTTPELTVTCAKAAPRGLPIGAGKSIAREDQLALPVKAALKTTTGFRFNFEDFVVGPCNELAYVASKSFCRQNVSSDQLFLCSSTGLGKTHLAQSMGSHLAGLSNKKSIRLAYLTAEEFASQLVMAIKSKRMEEFKARFRQEIDVLMLEDIHFFQGKEKIQNEFLSTINSLQCQGKKVVLTSTFLPKELNDVDSNLVSRLCRGFLAVIDKPDMGTRRKIIQNKADSLKADLPEDVADFLAGRIQKDIRQLESCLHNLVFKARMLKESISLELAMEVIKNYDIQDHKLDMEQILKQVCGLFDVSLDAICSKSRKKQYVLARNVAFYVARRYTDFSLKEIGGHLNRRHSTVIKGITNVEKEISRNSPQGRQLQQTINQVVV